MKSRVRRLGVKKVETGATLANVAVLALSMCLHAAATSSTSAGAPPDSDVCTAVQSRATDEPESDDDPYETYTLGDLFPLADHMEWDLIDEGADHDWISWVETEYAHAQIESAKRKRAPYTGDSERTNFRRRAFARTFDQDVWKSVVRSSPGSHSSSHESSAAAGGVSAAELPALIPLVSIPTPPAAEGFAPPPPLVVESGFEVENELLTAPMTDDECRKHLESSGLASTGRNKKTQSELTGFEYLRHRAVLRYFELRCQDSPLGKMEASMMAATTFCSKPSTHQGRRVREWASEYSLSGCLPELHQGAHVKTISYIHDADRANEIRRLIRAIPRNLRTSDEVAKAINASLPGLEISRATACRWLHQLGFYPYSLTSKTYTDGHERPDVIAYRNEFIKAMGPFQVSLCFQYCNCCSLSSRLLQCALSYTVRFSTLLHAAVQARMATYAGDDMLTELSPANTTLPRIIPFCHDESSPDSAGGRQKPWVEEGHTPMLPKRGTCVMVSAFLSPNGVEHWKMVEPTSEGWWTNRDLIKQLDEFLPTLAIRYPGCVGLFQFDNSGNHGMMAPDALSAARLNLGDGFPKQTVSDKDAGLDCVAFRNTTFTGPDGAEHTQIFTYTDATGALCHKGIKSILVERRLWREASEVIKTRYTLQKFNAHKFVDHEKGVRGPNIACTYRLHTEMHLEEARELLASQPDFVAQRSRNWITETVERHGHLAIFGPKFHPELAAIELLWGGMKKYLKKHCDYTVKTLKENIPKALDSISKTEIRRYFAHVARYMRAYATESLSLPQIEWSMRKYTSHRRAKESIPALDARFLQGDWFTDMPETLKQ